MKKMHFIWSGEPELPAGWTLQPHSHDFFHLAYVRKGRLIFHADGMDYPLSDGSVILFPPGVIHAVPQDTHILCTQYEVMFSIQDPELRFLFDTKTVLVLHGASHLENLFSYIRSHYNSVDPLCISCVDSFMSTILFSLLTGKDNSEAAVTGYVDFGGYSALVQRIICHVEKNSNEKYDLLQLAIALGLNKNYLCTAFRQETGITISEYINYHRIRRALLILQYNGCNKEFPIHDLAVHLGYGNASYFNRVFKRYTGMAPTDFMNALSMSKESSAFQKYYTEFLDLKRYPIKESLEYMKGLKDAADSDAIKRDT